MTMHMALVTATFLLSMLFWVSFRAHTAFLLFILSFSAYNGASFYFEVFAHRRALPPIPPPFPAQASASACSARAQRLLGVPAVLLRTSKRRALYSRCRACPEVGGPEVVTVHCHWLRPKAALDRSV